MGLLTQLRELTSNQRNAFLASFLGWTLDAFDFFVLVFVLKDVAHTFHTTKTHVAFALMLTLALRPVGAFVFGLAGDRYGRRGPLMVNILLFSFLELLSGFAPTLTWFLVLRALFGVAMGGEWGLGASLAMESVPAKARGALSGLLQEGYVVGYLLAAVVYRFVAPHLGWRWMFFVGVLPALLSLFIRAKVTESPAWQQARAERERLSVGDVVRRHGRLFLYLTLLMTGFCFLSHGSQDIYPTFLEVQRGLPAATVSSIAIFFSVGALLGGVFFGTLSQRIGRRKAIILACLCALPVIPLWAFSHTVAMVALGAFLIQFCIQGAWGIIPAHLSELAPPALRGTLPGLAIQMGNLIASVNGPLQTDMAARHGGNYGLVMAVVLAVALVAVPVIAGLGREAREAGFTPGGPTLEPVEGRGIADRVPKSGDLRDEDAGAGRRKGIQ